MKCYEPTEKLRQLKESAPEAADEIEQLCKGLLATRGLLIMYEQEATLAYVNRLTEPWVRLIDVKTETNKRSSDQMRKTVMKRWLK